MPRSRNTSPAEGLREALDGKVAELGGVDIDHSRIFSLTDYDYPDRHLLRSFCTAPAIPWSAFSPMRGITALPQELCAKSIMESVAKLTSMNSGRNNGASNNATGARGSHNGIAEPMRSIARFFEELCPDLCGKTKDALYRGATHLILAVVTGSVEPARRCLELGADPNDMSFLSDPDVAVNQMQHGYSAMFIAVIAGRLDVISLLREFGGSIHVYDRWGRTPLHAAVEIGKREVVAWLLAEGAPRCIGSCVTMLPDSAASPELALPIPALHSRPGPCSHGDAAVLCHCGSKRPKGYCGCVDDMFLRWSYDRLQQRWLSGMDLSALSASCTSGPCAPSCVR
ncbi:uncharacterized protein Tco025E_04948 [Trypanosoma conorhini]|uniref:Uncharacterized protein n=1 Tax=Trypanosoma conorhini TaxID=83891 RepID=A0A422PI13_9TRYP|nr:uncharacterized protein Tco025E_04948 [Trypanosoma conorhini]RNF17331.1 hypothetical protein Tco025E_04948 [Trypanosoma conorhini]